jgi:hypothetical protein
MKPPKLPVGTKRAIARALDIAIDALEGREINPVPQARPTMARRLKRARRLLLEAKVIWP